MAALRDSTLVARTLVHTVWPNAVSARVAPRTKTAVAAGVVASTTAAAAAAGVLAMSTASDAVAKPVDGTTKIAELTARVDAILMVLAAGQILKGRL